MDKQVKPLTCTVCGSDSRVILKDARLSLYKCNACRHTMTGHSTADPEEIYSADYFSDEHKNWFQNPNRKLFRAILKSIRHYGGNGPVSVLDIGCGNGDFLKFIQKEEPSWKLTGVDRAPNAGSGICFVQQDFFEFNTAERFDAAVSLTVIEHVEDVGHFVKKAGELLKPGGLFITTTNNNNSLLYRMARILNRVGLREAYDRVYSSHHVNHFTNHSLRILLQRGGFKVLSLRNHNYPLKAVDTPPASPMVMSLHKAAVVVIFFLSWMIGKGFLQTYVCVKQDKH